MVATTSLSPWSATSRTMAAPAGSAVRAAAATHMPTPMVAAAARAIGMRAARRQVLTVSWKWTGIRRSTSTKTIIETVSTQNWVSARSGAPWTTKSRAAPYPVRPARTTAFMRRRTVRHSRAAAQVRAATAPWSGLSQSRGRTAPSQGVSMTRTASCPASMTRRVVARYTEREPRWMKPVTWRARRSCPSSRWPKTLSAVGQAIRRESRVTRARPRKSTVPAAQARADRSRARPNPCQRARWYGFPSAGNVSAYAPSSRSVQPTPGPRTRPRTASRAGGARKAHPTRWTGVSGTPGLRANAPQTNRRLYAVVSADPATTTASAHRSAAEPCSSASNAASFAANPSSGGRAAMEAAASTATPATYGRERPTPESRRRSRVPAAWSTMPVTRNSGALKRACPRIIAAAASAAFRLPVPASRVRKPSWLTVP